MFSKFMGAFGKQKLEEAKQGITEAIVKFDPESATEAQLSMMEEGLDKMALQVAELRQTADKETREAEEAKSTYNRYLAAAQNIQGQLEDTGNPPSAAQAKKLNTSLDQLMEKLEELRPEVAREIQEAEEATQDLEEMESFLKERADQLKGARKKLEAAQRNMQRSQRDQERAAAKEQRARELAGLKGGSDGMSIALNAMDEVANSAKAEADAKLTKAELLTPVSLKDDANIAAALDAVDGVDTSKSASDKLAGLKAF